MKKCIIPGSFDPVTAGHVAIIRSAAQIFDEVCIVIVANAEKHTAMFTPDERLSIIRAMCAKLGDEGITNLSAMIFRGLTVEAARSVDANYIVRGIRSSADFQYEYELSQISRRLAPEIQTVFLPSDSEMIHVSSTYVRELIRYGLTDSPDIAPGTVDVMKNILENRQGE